VVCPVESPDGLNIGITKHLATLCHVTGTLDPKPLLHHLRQLGLLRPDDSSSSQQLKKKSRVIVNDILRGVTLRPLEMERYLLALRRNGLLHPHISITWDVLSREFRVATSGGRCTRPLFIVDHTGPVEQPGGTSRPGWMRAADKPIDRWDWRTMVLGTLLTQQEKDAIMPSTTGFSHDTLFVHTLEGDDDTRGGRAKKVPPASAAANAANAANAERYFAKGEGDVVAATERLAVTAGVVEFVDVEEASSRLVAVAPQDLEVRPCQHYTHCEIHPSTILGIPASCIPFMDRNQAPRNVLSMSQSKQSVGVSVTNLDNRMDTMSAVLHYPQRPLVTTSSAHRLMGGNLAYGENLVVAIASFTGYNQEDAVILNRDSVMRGCFSVTHLHTLKFEESVEGNERVLIAHPLLRTDVETVSEMEAEEEKRYASLDKDGLPVVGAQVREGDALLGMVHVSRVVRMERDTIGLSHVVENEVHTDCTERVDRSSRGTVDRVFRHASSAEDGGTKCKVRVRQGREPELGDKCASRHGQKGVVGMLVPAIDMPYGATSGLVPDIVINPNAFPKRMTVGHLMEALLSKACVVAGRRVSCDTFERADVLGTAEDVLEQGHGMHRHSDEIMYNGRTGEQIATSVFLAPTYYMRLKHMVADKINHRSTGPHTAITRQPTQGRGKHGGLRVGEMEHQALLSHGASGFLKESFMERSDGHYMDLDVDAGVPVRISSRVRGEEDGMRMRLLAHDEDDVDIRRVRVPYAFKLMHQEVHALGVDMRMLVAADVAEGEDDALPRIHNRVLNLLQHTSCSQL
jgi:DNA-directed RNA polymerase II subunit RPB2